LIVPSPYTIDTQPSPRQIEFGCLLFFHCSASALVRLSSYKRETKGNLVKKKLVLC
jgi:hypothetical protein